VSYVGVYWGEVYLALTPYGVIYICIHVCIHKCMYIQGLGMGLVLGLNFESAVCRMWVYIGVRCTCLTRP